jgi:hypothetical protein
MTSMLDLMLMLQQRSGGAAPDAAYGQWLQKYGIREDPTYDTRAAFDAGLSPDERGHLGDEFKRPSHPTFSSESRYSNKSQPGGEWVAVGPDRWAFKASTWNLKNMSREKLMDYFDRVEPGNAIEFPDGTSYVGGSRR